MYSINNLKDNKIRILIFYVKMVVEKIKNNKIIY